VSARTRRIGAIVRKDAIEFSRDRFWAFMTVLGLVFYTLVFWLMPTSVDETVAVGVHGGAITDLTDIAGVGSAQGFELVEFATTADLRNAVDGSGDVDVAIGVDVPDDMVAALAAGDPITITTYVGADVPAELRTAVDGLLGEVAFALVGQEAPVTFDRNLVVLGIDRAGAQVPLRERMRPLIVFFGLMIESMALAALVASEIQRRTVTAVITTPTRVGEFLAAKAVVGTLLAFTESVVLLAVTATTTRLDVILPTVLLGAVLVTGFGLVAGSAGRDFMSIIFLSMLFMVPMAIPAMGVLFPGSAATWVQLLPTYGLVQALVGVTAYGAGWSDVAGDLARLAGWCALAGAAGLFALRRKVAAL